MLKESILLGLTGIILGISIFIKTAALIPSLIPIAIGVSLIIFYKEENKIEKRKDTQTKNKKLAKNKK